MVWLLRCRILVMPEHVHLLLTEPERTKLSVALQMLKQNVAHSVNLTGRGSSRTALTTVRKK
jgi:REP element-mobilizing transposase RayT